MSIALRTALLACWLPLTGCALFGHDRAETEGPVPEAVPGWRTVATPADRERIRNWRSSWTQALARVAAAGQSARLNAEGSLLQPDAALPGPTPPPGAYRCRVTKLGAKLPGGSDYVAYPAYNCRIAFDGIGLTFAKLDGSQRPVGRLYPHDEARMIFLGTMLLGDEIRAMAYGRDAERDMVGTLERIGPNRWRLVIPAPRWESMLDVIELAPL